MNRYPPFPVIPRLLAAAVLAGLVGCDAGLEDSPEKNRLIASVTGAEVEASAWWPVGSMAYNRDGYSASVLLANGSVLVAGGEGADYSYPRGTELFNPATATWTAAGNLSRGKGALTLTRLDNGKVLALGGMQLSGDQIFYFADVELYDPTTNSWTPTTPMQRTRASHTATLLGNGKVLVVGGYTQSGIGGVALRSADLYDPTTNTWSAAGQVDSPIFSNHTATLLPDGKVLVVAGNGHSYLYAPATNSWTDGGTMTFPRYSHSATLLPDGRVLAAGGITQGTPATTATTELYVPAVSSLALANYTWVVATPMAVTRKAHGAVWLDDGKVMVAGGQLATSSSVSTTSVELYDPATGAWTAGPSLTTARKAFTLQRLPSGNVLAAGPGQTAELYRTNEERELGSATGTVVAGTTCGAYSDFAPSCDGANAASDIAFLWTAPKSASFIFSTSGSALDTVLEVRNASTGALLGCSDDSDGMTHSTLWLKVTAGQKVRIVMDGWSTRCGNFKLSIVESAWNPL